MILTKYNIIPTLGPPPLLPPCENEPLHTDTNLFLYSLFFRYPNGSYKQRYRHGAGVMGVKKLSNWRLGLYLYFYSIIIIIINHNILIYKVLFCIRYPKNEIKQKLALRDSTSFLHTGISFTSPGWKWIKRAVLYRYGMPLFPLLVMMIMMMLQWDWYPILDVTDGAELIDEVNWFYSRATSSGVDIGSTRGARAPPSSGEEKNSKIRKRERWVKGREKGEGRHLDPHY